MNNRIKVGDVILLSLPKHYPKGHEQEGKRPGIVIAIPEEPLRYPVIIVVPLTTRKGNWVLENPNLYKEIPAGNGNLPKNSIALIDQVCAVDCRRIVSLIGTIDDDYILAIKNMLIELIKG
jgi:mRNA interferase MazF